MSHYGQGPPPPGQPPYQGAYPQQGYGGPPPMNQGYPPQQGYGPGPQGYGGPGGSPYPPQGGQWGPPPGPPSNYNQHPGQYGQPPPGQYGQPPPGQYGQPPPGQYGQPPPGQYGPPTGQHGGYGGPAPPTPPSPGYVPGQPSPADMSRAADELRSAMKGFGTNDNALIKALAHLGPLEINGVRSSFEQRHHRDLLKDIHSETSNCFREALMAIARGPLEQDCHVLNEAIKGPGTKESALNEVLLSRSNADMNAIKAFYHRKYKRTLESDVKADLSMKTERLFDMVIAARRAEDSTPVIPQQVEADVREVYRATEGRTGTDQLTVCSIFAERSDGQLRAISHQYKQTYRITLEECIRREFTGHMQDALLYMLHTAEDPAKHDADLLQDAMRGMGTKDSALIRQIVKIHWNPERRQQCVAAYRHFHKRELAQSIRDETSGDYEKLLIACLG